MYFLIIIVADKKMIIVRMKQQLTKEKLMDNSLFGFTVIIIFHFPSSSGWIWFTMCLILLLSVW